MTDLTPANLFGLDGKTALVTGGGRGIGAMFAEGLLGAGARVIISSRRQEQLDEAAEELSGIGPVEAIAADLLHRGGLCGSGRGGRRANRSAGHPGQQRRGHLGSADARSSPTRPGTG